MAHTVVGIDVGAQAVKFSLVEAGFRQTRPRGAFAEPVLAGEQSLAERQGEALRRGLEQLPQESTLVFTMPGELLTMRVLDLPFSDPRKIDQVVGYELEGQIVHALADVIYDHQIIRAPSPEGTSVLVVAARIDDVGNLLAELAAHGLDPRALYPAPLIYEALFGEPGRDGRSEEGTIPSCRVVVDIGHLRTNICILQDEQAVLGRTVLRGGAQLTAAIATVLGCDEDTAEEIKKSRAAIGANATPEAIRLDGILRDALAPLLRDVRQTLASVRARVRTPIQSILLTGGTAALAGLDEYLASELELPVSLWDGIAGPGSAAASGAAGPLGSLGGLGSVDGPTSVDTDAVDIDVRDGQAEPDSRFALASAAAWAGAGGARRIDLRRGPFVYKASLSIIRQKAVHLGALAAAVVLAVTMDAAMALGRLRQEHEQLSAQLRAQTQELFGTPKDDGRQVVTMLTRNFKEEMAPIPKATAYDILGEISRKVPSNDEMKLDILELDIKPKKVFIRGTLDSFKAVDDLQAKLKAIDCFEEISKGLINEVSGGAKSFTLTIATKC
jgi:general secretion pathway protein L